MTSGAFDDGMVYSCVRLLHYSDWSPLDGRDIERTKLVAKK
jgi:hypothetical protein